MSGGARVTQGCAEPLGADLTATGINVAVHAPAADAVEVCVYGPDGDIEIARHVLPGRTGPVAHGHVRGLGVGARYGLRAHGPFDPGRGLRFNPNKLLLDPYALHIDRPFALHPSLFGYSQDDPQGGATFDEADSGPFMPKAVVMAPGLPPPAPPPMVPWDRMVIYELHVRGFTRRMPGVPEALRGTFAGLAHPAAVDHLRRLGVTTVELMPAMAWIDERHLPPLGLTNYWGYNPVAWMAPDPRLAPGGWAEVRAAADALAEAGIETVLDVVLNHSGESDALGPTLSLRGLDNAGYYRLRADDPARYVDDAGTGDILALDRPAPLRLAMDALRAWRGLGGVSGFRFDLATVLGRRPDGFDPQAPLLAAIDQDPALRDLKRIAEPWDCGPGGYQLGRFPAAWGEWNDRFRSTARSFWRGDDLPLGELARRVSGSADLLPGRPPSRGVNFVVAHDGFTLADLVAYSAKRNAANGEQGRDGSDDNRSWNNGVEGPSSDPAVIAARLNDQRALLATLILARGTPMLAMGAELGQSQGGNNNAYAQDNEVSWLDWSAADPGLTDFAARLIAARRAHPALRADRLLTGRPQGRGLDPDVEWRRADGAALQPVDWDDPHGRTLVVALCEDDGEGPDRVILALHRGGEAATVRLPEPRDGQGWTVLIDSADPKRGGLVEGEAAVAAPRSVLLLVETPSPGRAGRGVDDAVLARLSDAAGVGRQWWSVDGQGHAVSPESQRALLAALGRPAASNRQALESLRDLAEDLDRPALPATVIGRIGEPVRLALGFEPGQPSPDTWLCVQGESGPPLRLRAAPHLGETGESIGRDGRTGGTLTLALPPLPAGRYLIRREDRPDALARLTVAPRACRRPDEGRRFGLSAQLYSVPRAGDQGIGDLTTLGLLGRAAAAQGASLLAINPLHALFPHQRDKASPYYPSDRRFLDPIYLDVARIVGAGAEAAALSRLTQIDHGRVWALKSRALEAAFAAGVDDPALDAFIARGGPALESFAVFEALAEERPGQAWRDWPQGLHDPAAPAVAAFAGRRRDRVRYHQFLQWLCEEQLAEAARQADGLTLGLCRDLAIGAAPDGAEAWSQSALMAQGVSIGAPPDPIGPEGQIWGLPPFDPHRLWADGLRAPAELFAANMRHAGALRVDHVMGLARQFWVPKGAAGADGAYVAFPLEALLAELALESGRAGCLVIGEDLGSVPDGLRETLAEAAVLSYRVLPFERDGARLRPPEAYPRLALACVSTHDLPTLAGWWDGLDIDERLQLRLCTAAAAEAGQTERRAEKQALLDALAEAGLTTDDTAAEGPMIPTLAALIHGFIARTPSVLALAQIEDLMGATTAVNLPGTDRERPNWRRRLPQSVDGFAEAEPARSILAALRAARPSI